MRTPPLRRPLTPQARRHRRPPARPRLEALEDRTTPSTVTWISTTSGDWADGTNWSTGQAPGANDDVTIDQPGVTVTHSSGTDSVHSLTEGSSSDLDLTGGSLSFATTFTVNGTLEVDGGTLDLTNKTLDGTGTVTNEPNSSWALRHSTIKPALDNQGTLEARGGVDIQGTFGNDAGATLREVGDGTGLVSGVVLRVANGFTNHGLIELDGSGTDTSWLNSSLGVASGTLVNASDGTIHALAGQGGRRTLSAELNNQGTLTVDALLEVGRDNAAHTNSGTINVTGADLNINGSGSSTRFTNTGDIFIDSGRSLNLNYNGTQFYQNAGSITGTGTLHLYGATGNFAGDFTTNGLNLYIEGDQASYNSGGTLTVTSDSTLSFLRAPAVNADLENAGTVVVRGSPRFNGAYTSDPGSTLRVLGNKWTFGSNLIVANGFTNHGLIELNSEDAAYNSTLTTSAGALTNAGDGTIEALPGTGGSRTLTAPGGLANDGTVYLAAGVTLNLGGDFTQNAGGDLSVEIGGSSSFGRLAVAGAANLDGTLSVILIGGYTPPSGTTFKVLTANQVSGTFATLDQDATLFTPAYNLRDVTLTAN